ncbi:hypothetical protein [Marisediminicola sp. LYQ134]|uniref:hypothetical protein n=1 Tax=unclassified Marisediminicola TaxID=2618316 RepID=UPI0039831FEC
MSRARILLILGATVPALLAGAIGLTHPMRLTPDTAGYWRDMHIVLLFVFPLMGLAPWLVARAVDRRLGWLGAFFGYGFATLYTALDVLAGIGGGALVAAGEPDATSPIFRIANLLATAGVWSLVAGTLVAGVAAFIRSRLASIPGTLLAVVGAYLIAEGHVFFPLGTVAMLLLAGGYAILAVVVSRPRAIVGQPADASS